MTLNIRSRSPKTIQLFPLSKQCICASLVKTHPLVQKITSGNEATGTQTGSAPNPPLAGGGGGGGGGGRDINDD